MKRKVYVLFLLFFLLLGFGLTNTVLADVNVNISINEKDNIVKIMEDIEIPEGEEVSGDLVAILGDISIKGRVKGNVASILGNIDVNNFVGGDLTSVLGDVTRGEQAEIRGKTTEVSVGSLNNIKSNFSPLLINFFGWNFRFLKLIFLFGLAVLTLSLMPESQKKMVKALEREPGRTLIIGIISVLVFPVVMFLFALTIVGIPFIPVIILSIAVAKFIGYVAVVYLIGDRIADIGNKKINIYLKILMGVVSLWILNLIPFLSVFFYFIIMFFALGVVIDTKFGTNRPWFNRKNSVEEE